MPFAKQILRWYAGKARELPWRRTSDPYLIWLSEVILQQTRVDQGMDYYHRFAERYPGVGDLASASEEEVLKLWQGLGYYSRARNMLHAARQVMDEFGGEFPADYEDLLRLKGVGEYTAAAIASIAFGQVVPVVDGNVKRVISRIFGLKSSGAELHSEARAVMGKKIDPSRPGDYNQAVMEFGALHCLPRNPGCDNCIFRKDCFAYNNGMVEALPAREKKRSPRKRYFNYLVIQNEKNEFFMRLRAEDGIWKNLYDFPLIESGEELDPKKLQNHPDLLSWLGKEVVIVSKTGVYRHQLSHRSIFARFHFIDIRHSRLKAFPANWVAVSPPEMHRLPVPRLIEKFLSDQDMLE